MISSLRLWHSIGIILIHHNNWHKLQSFGTHFSGNTGKVSWHESLVAVQDMSSTQKEFFSKICTLAWIILVIPATKLQVNAAFLQ